MEVIYVDSVFLFDLLIDYLLCLLTGRFCALRLRRGRYFLAALVGAVYSVAVFFPGLGWLNAPLCRLCAAGFMGLAAFGGEERLFRCIGAFLALSSASAGVMYALGLDRGRVELWKLTGLFLLCYGFLTVLGHVRSGLSGQRYAQVELEFSASVYSFRALVDTGNRLTDPITGGRVVLLSPAVLEKSLGELAYIPDPVEFMASASRRYSGVFRLIPFSSVGGGGMLPAFTPRSLTLDGKAVTCCTAALSARAAGDGFDGIVPSAR